MVELTEEVRLLQLPPVTGDRAHLMARAIACAPEVSTLPVWALGDTNAAMMANPMMASSTPTIPVMALFSTMHPPRMQAGDSGHYRHARMMPALRRLAMDRVIDREHS
jgi:hypothetical protein